MQQGASAAEGKNEEQFGKPADNTHSTAHATRSHTQSTKRKGYTTRSEPMLPRLAGGLSIKNLGEHTHARTCAFAHTHTHTGPHAARSHARTRALHFVRSLLLLPLVSRFPRSLWLP